MAHEIEIKLGVPNPRALKRRLRDLGYFPVSARHFERNLLFDFSDLRLRRSRRLLRVRLVDGHGLVTFKDAPFRDRHYKVRREIEAAVEDGLRVADILREIGLREIFRYEKYRTVFAQAPGSKRAGGVRGRTSRRVPTSKLVFDETPIGNYVELEGPKRWIDRVARQLGYSREDYVAASYGTLYRRKCLEQGRRPGNMVFRKYRLGVRSA